MASWKPRGEAVVRRVLLVLSFALIACAKPHNQNPYWAKSDKLFLEFADAPKDFPSEEVTQKNVERMQCIRRDTALLDHPEWANTYHDLFVELIQHEIESLAANQITSSSVKALADLATPGLSRESLDRDLKLQNEGLAQIEATREKTRKMLNDLTTERERIGGPPWPLPWLRRTPSKGGVVAR